jgi:hypothetical protein
LMVRYKAIHLKFAENWEEEYERSNPVDQIGEKSAPVGETASPREKKVVKRESTLQKKAREKIAARKAKESSTRTIREKKISE